MFACRFTRSHLSAYVDGSLHPARRRRVAAHLDHCDACYARYAQQRDLQRKLQRELPLMGQGTLPDFDRLWTGISPELPAPQSSRPAQPQFRYGLAVLVMVVLLLLPLALPDRDAALALTLPAAPVPEQLAEATPTAESVRVSLQTTAAASLTLTSHNRIVSTPPGVPEPQIKQDED